MTKKSEYINSLRGYFTEFNKYSSIEENKTTKVLKSAIKVGLYNKKTFWDKLSPSDWLRMVASYNGAVRGLKRRGRFKSDIFFIFKLTPWSFEVEKDEENSNFGTYVTEEWKDETNMIFGEYDKFKKANKHLPQKLENKFKELLERGIVTKNYVQSEATRDKFKDLPGDFYELRELKRKIQPKTEYEMQPGNWQGLTRENEEKVDNMIKKFREVKKKIENVSIKDVKKTGDNQDIWVKLENLLIKMKGTTITYDTAPKTLNGLANMFTGLKDSISDIMNDGSVQWNPTSTSKSIRVSDGYHNLKF